MPVFRIHSSLYGCSVSADCLCSLAISKSLCETSLLCSRLQQLLCAVCSLSECELAQHVVVSCLPNLRH